MKILSLSSPAATRKRLLSMIGRIECLDSSSRNTENDFGSQALNKTSTWRRMMENCFPNLITGQGFPLNRGKKIVRTELFQVNCFQSPSELVSPHHYSTILPPPLLSCCKNYAWKHWKVTNNTSFSTVQFLELQNIFQLLVVPNNIDKEAFSWMSTVRFIHFHQHNSSIPPPFQLANSGLH